MSSPYGYPQQQGGDAGQYYAPQQQQGYYPPPQGQYGGQPGYQPQPQPQTIYVQQERPKDNDHSCCWGCLVAMCICCALDEIC